MDSFFPATYEDSRARFLRSLNLIQQKWPSTQLETHTLKNFPELSSDWLWAHPHKKETLFILSTAEHGIEGYVGAAMLKIFIEEFAPQIHEKNTGLLLAHAMNPWGMKHHRKVNENNVDLNRNFIYSNRFNAEINPDYKALAYLLTRQEPIDSFFLENVKFWERVLKALILHGTSSVSTAALLGQYHTPKGFFFGGLQHEESARLIMRLFRAALDQYESVVHLDMHTGYGPRYRMSVLLSPLDPISSEDLARKINYPLVYKVNPKEFYAISGDICAYFYELRNAEFPTKKLFSGGYEFGTFGDSLVSRIRSLRAMVFENQLYWHGAKNEEVAKQIRGEFEELYFPTELKWREKALADGRQAFRGILKAYDLM
jgi:hypothetical protein